MDPIFPTAPIRTASCLAVPFLMAAMAAAHGADAKPKVAVAAFGLYGDQNVFESEATRAAKIVAERFGGSSISIHANTKSREDANLETITATLQSVSKAMDADNDVLFVILTSHGSRAGLEVKAGSHEEVLSPLALVKALDETTARYRVVIISACYAGVFLRPLADPNTLVITAADTDHASFGCRSGNEWTYFGDALFNTAMRHASDMHEAFTKASTVVRQRERSRHLEASNPQIAGGENVEHVLKGELDKVAAYSREGSGLDPKYAFSRGIAADARGDYSHAIVAYGEAIQHDARFPIAYNNRGVAYFKTGDNDHAIADCTKAISLYPRVASPYANRARAYRAKGDNDHAIADYTRAIGIDAKYADAYNNRGLTYSAKGDNDRAIADYTKAIKLDPKLANAFENRGRAYHAKGDDGRASSDFEEAARIDPKLAEVLKAISTKP